MMLAYTWWQNWGAFIIIGATVAAMPLLAWVIQSVARRFSYCKCGGRVKFVDKYVGKHYVCEQTCSQCGDKHFFVGL